MLIWALRIWFSLVFVTMCLVVGGSLLKESLFAIPPFVARDPWFIATVFDAYFAFMVFYFWVYYRATSWLNRLIWFVLIMGLGNIAMAFYMLQLLFRLPTHTKMSDILLKKEAA